MVVVVPVVFLLRNVNYGRLWVHIAAGMRDAFLTNLDANIAEGDSRWIEWWGDLNAGPLNTECFDGANNNPLGEWNNNASFLRV